MKKYTKIMMLATLALVSSVTVSEGSVDVLNGSENDVVINGKSNNIDPNQNIIKQSAQNQGNSIQADPNQKRSKKPVEIQIEVGGNADQQQDQDVETDPNQKTIKQSPQNQGNSIQADPNQKRSKKPAEIQIEIVANPAQQKDQDVEVDSSPKRSKKPVEDQKDLQPVAREVEVALNQTDAEAAAIAALQEAAKAEAAAERAMLKFVKPDNVQLMKMLTLIQNRENELNKFVGVLKIARKADQLRQAKVLDNNAINELKEQMIGFFDMLSIVKADNIIIESLDKSPLVDWNENNPQVPLLLEIIKLSQNERINRLKEAVAAQLLPQVAAVYKALMINMSPAMRKIVVAKMQEAENNPIA